MIFLFTLDSLPLFRSWSPLKNWWKIQPLVPSHSPPTNCTHTQALFWKQFKGITERPLKAHLLTLLAPELMGLTISLWGYGTEYKANEKNPTHILGKHRCLMKKKKSGLWNEMLFLVRHIKFITNTSLLIF